MIMKKPAMLIASFVGKASSTEPAITSDDETTISLMDLTLMNSLSICFNI